MIFASGDQRPDPERLAELYIELTDDLAYARTFYPRSKTVRYLNGLAAHTHLAIYQNKKEKQSRFLRFWRHELPLIYRETRSYMGYALLIFLLAIGIGLLSAFEDHSFVRVILGDQYVDMTIRNIEDGNPLGVYDSEAPIPMFLTIALNNIRVAFLTFALGIIFSLGTIWLLFTNGVMVGAFLGFFIHYQLQWQALPIIFIHGTLELSAIVIAGGAGMHLGNSLLFPGTYTRLQSLQMSARRGVKILVGLVPIFILAAFLEGFVTRLTHLPLGIKLLIILASLAFLFWYYLYLPSRIGKDKQQPSLPPAFSQSS